MKINSIRLFQAKNSFAGNKSAKKTILEPCHWMFQRASPHRSRDGFTKENGPRTAERSH